MGSPAHLPPPHSPVSESGDLLQDYEAQPLLHDEAPSPAAPARLSRQCSCVQRHQDEENNKNIGDQVLAGPQQQRKARLRRLFHVIVMAFVLSGGLTLIVGLAMNNASNIIAGGVLLGLLGAALVGFWVYEYIMYNCRRHHSFW